MAVVMFASVSILHTKKPSKLEMARVIKESNQESVMSILIKLAPTLTDERLLNTVYDDFSKDKNSTTPGKLREKFFETIRSQLPKEFVEGKSNNTLNNVIQSVLSKLDGMRVVEHKPTVGRVLLKGGVPYGRHYKPVFSALTSFNASKILTPDELRLMARRKFSIFRRSQGTDTRRKLTTELTKNLPDDLKHKPEYNSADLFVANFILAFAKDENSTVAEALEEMKNPTKKPEPRQRDRRLKKPN